MAYTQNFPINDELREQLKHPLGRLIPDPLVGAEVLSPYFANAGTVTVCVGDRTTERTEELGFSPSLEIVDSFEKRAPRGFPKLFDPNRTILRTVNPSGTISSAALETLAQALKIIRESMQNKVRIEVKGEEDLLALPVVAFFPDPTFALYGQPNEGMVIVSSHEGSERTRVTLKSMGIASLPRN